MSKATRYLAAGTAFYSLLAVLCIAAPAAAPIAQAELSFRAGEYVKALPLFQQQLTAASDAEAAGKALYHIGQCLAGTKRYAEATAAFENVAVKFPSSSWADDAFLRKGAVEAGLLKNPQSGIATWQELVKKYPQSELVAEAQFLSGMINWINGQKPRARENWNDLIRDFPNNKRAAQAKLYLKD